ncbi:MAG: copper chaperone PCu(A)C [gamma proteobacterium symbiont of Bathyaustriella thionipta]|nr:copper chaperone PCu(A)C [gamma proteobacterium symbiont of Bathyaustriella thionipta]
MKLLSAFFYVCLTLLTLQPVLAADSATLQVENAWVREGPPGMPMMGGFMSVTNNSTGDVSITRISSPAFKSIELHETIMQDGMAKMREVSELRIPAGQTVVLEPGGKHMMLFNPVKPLKAGDTVTFQLSGSDDQRVEFSASVKRR